MRIQLLLVVAIGLLVGCANQPEQNYVQDTAQDPAQRASQSTIQDPQSLAPNTGQGTAQTEPQSPEPMPETPPSVSPPLTPEVALASYLNQSGAILYDAENCAYCQKQQRMFGAAAFQQLRVVNCGPWNAPERACRRLGIRTFPTWEIGGRRYPTILPLDEISEISGFNRSRQAGGSGNEGGFQ